MNKKLEQKILDEIRRRVLEKDEELKNREDQKNIQDATKEALTEMTSLSREEVDYIANQVTAEEKKKAQRKKNLVKQLSLWGITVLGIVLYFVYQHFDKVKYVENFDSEQAGWDVFDKFEYKRFFDNGSYAIENGIDAMCAWDYIPIVLPAEYSIELTSKWNNGMYGEYGVPLLQDESNYFFFEIRSDGAATVNYKKDGKWTNNYEWRNDFVKNPIDNPVIQRIDIVNGHYKYFVNDEFLQEGSLENYLMAKIGCMVCYQQRVDFSHLVVKQMNLGQFVSVLLDEKFENKNAGWTEESKFTKKCWFENGKYFLKNNVKDKCFWSVKSFNLPKDYKITLTALWQTGEMDSWDLILRQDDDNYYAFQMKASGEARYVIYSGGAYTKVPVFKKINVSGKDKKPNDMILNVKDGQFTFYINDQFVDTGYYINMNFSDVGVRVCGQQTVAFDKLIIEEQ
jgi:hypothetical protein